MNIVVCIKQVPDTDGPIRIDTSTKSIDDRYLAGVVNPFDEMALEEAVRLKEDCSSGQVTVISMGSSSAEKALRRCLAAGADRAIILCDPAFDNADSYLTGAILARAITSLDYDLVLCGARAADTNAGQVAAVVAELLGIPLVTAVARIEASGDANRVIVQRKLERGDREVVEAELPAVLAVELGHRPRYPSLPSRRAAAKENIECYDATTLGFGRDEVGPLASKTTVLSVSPPKPKARKLFAPDSSLSPAERMRLLMSGGIQEKESDFLEGDPKEVAAKLVGFLRSEGLLPF